MPCRAAGSCPICGHLHHGSPAPAKLGAIVVRVQLELLNRIDGRFDGLVRGHHDAAEVVVVIAFSLGTEVPAVKPESTL